MANANTPYISKAAAPLGNATSLTVFQQALNPLTTIAMNQTAQSAYIAFKAYAANNAAGTATGASNEQNFCYFVIRAGGRVVGGATTNFTPSIQLGRSVTAAQNTTIGTLNAMPFNTVSGNWIMQAFLTYDPVSGQINGNVAGWGGGGGTQTPTAPAYITPVNAGTIAAPATSVTGAYSAGELALYFSVAGLFSASNANNNAFLDSFGVEVL